MPKMKRPRQAYTLEEKIEIIKRMERGEKPKDISRVLHVPSPTICTIYKMREQIQKQYNEGNIGACTLYRLTRARHTIFDKLENYLVQWIDEQRDRGVPLSTVLIREEAMKLFRHLKEEMAAEGDTTVNELDFKASPGWFDRFKTRSHLRHIHLHGEGGFTETTAATFPVMLEKIVKEGGYTAHQIFNIDETGLFWKRIPSRSFIAQDDARLERHISSKDRITVVLGTNCAGDVRLKPLLVYHLENPRALKGIVKSSLPVMWRANKKGRVTRDLFSDYVYSYMSPFITEYTKEKNLENKALLIIDHASAHPPTITDLCENIQVVFLPPNTSSFLQPMEQGAVHAFKSHYIYLLMQFLARASDVDREASLTELLKQFTIRQCIEFIDQAFKMVSQETMNAVWKKLLPKFAADILCFDEIIDVKQKIVSLAQEAGLDGVEADDVDELLSLHSEEMAEEIQETENPVSQSEEEEDGGSDRVLDSQTLQEILNMSDCLAKIVTEKDPDMTRGLTFKHALMNAVECYKNLYEKKFKARKQVLIPSFYPGMAMSSKQEVPQPSTSGLQVRQRKRKLSETPFVTLELKVENVGLEEM